MWRRIWGAEPEPTETPTPAPELTDEALIQRTAEEIVQRRLAAPAVFLLESSRPLSFIASQGLVVLGPFVDAAFDAPHYEAFCRMIENRDNVEKLTQRIEELEEERVGGSGQRQAQGEAADEEE